MARALNADALRLMRSHYEGSWFDDREELGAGPYHSPYRARPITFDLDGKHYAFNRNIGYVGTFFHFVNHARGEGFVPPSAGGVTWFGVDDSSLSVRVPMYAVTSSAPETYAYGNGDTSHFQWRAAFWAFNTVANFVYSRHSVVGADVQRRIVEAESRCGPRESNCECGLMLRAHRVFACFGQAARRSRSDRPAGCWDHADEGVGRSGGVSVQLQHDDRGRSGGRLGGTFPGAACDVPRWFDCIAPRAKARPAGGPATSS